MSTGFNEAGARTPDNTPAGSPARSGPVGFNEAGARTPDNIGAAGC